MQPIFRPLRSQNGAPAPPPFVRMQQPLHSCCRTKDHVDALAVVDLCAKSHPQRLWWYREIEISSPPWPLRAARSPIQLPHVIIDFLAPKRPPELHEGSIESLWVPLAIIVYELRRLLRIADSCRIYKEQEHVWGCWLRARCNSTAEIDGAEGQRCRPSA